MATRTQRNIERASAEGEWSTADRPQNLSSPCPYVACESPDVSASAITALTSNAEVSWPAIARSIRITFRSVAASAKPKGHDIGSLGPGDSSDTGSDLAGLQPNADEIGFGRGADEDIAGGHATDIDTDRIVAAEDAGLGGGLDQAEEAQDGVQDDDDPSAETPHGSANPDEHGDSRSTDDRHRRIAEAADHRAQQRGFAPGQEEDDWTVAEKDIDAGSKSHEAIASPLFDPSSPCPARTVTTDRAQWSYRVFRPPGHNVEAAAPETRGAADYSSLTNAYLP